MKYARFLDFTHYVLIRFFQHNCTQVASSLTFTTLLSLVPFIAIALSIVAAFPAFAQYHGAGCGKPGHRSVYAAIRR
jgi:membrane protein